MSKQAVINAIIGILVAVNAILTMTGRNPIPIEDEMIETVINGVVTIVGIVWLWWKDSPVTEEAKRANAQMKAEKEFNKGYVE